MRIQIRTRQFDLTNAIRSHIERRLSFALDRFSSRILVVLVLVKARNGPKRRRDAKCCGMIVDLIHKSVVLEERARIPPAFQGLCATPGKSILSR
jgi:ribosome-associated translation inhibitor RaiA